jgi:hypothetical protein
MAGQTFQREERQDEQAWRSEENMQDRFARVQQAQAEATGRAQAATTEAQAKLNAANAEAAAKVTATKTYLSGMGYSDKEAADLSIELGDVENAKNYVAGRTAKQEADRKAAEDRAAKDAQLKAAANATLTLDELSDPNQPWSKTLPKGEIGRLRAQLSNPATANEAAIQVEQLGSRLRLAGSSINAANAYETWVKKNANTLTPTHREMVNAEMRKVKGFADSLKDPAQVNYYLQVPEKLDERLEEMRKSREMVDDLMAGYGPEAKFWQTEAERGRAALRPKSGQNVMLDFSTGGVIYGMSPQEAAQLEDAAIEEARRDINYQNLLKNDSQLLGMGLLAQTPEERMKALQQIMSVSDAERVSTELDKLTAKSRKRVLESRGYTVSSLAPWTKEAEASDKGKALLSKVDGIFMQSKPKSAKLREAIDAYSAAGYYNQNFFDAYSKAQVKEAEELRTTTAKLKDVSAKDYGSFTQQRTKQVDERMKAREGMKPMDVSKPDNEALMRMLLLGFGR